MHDDSKRPSIEVYVIFTSYNLIIVMSFLQFDYIPNSGKKVCPLGGFDVT
ncbi:hypothetical protein THZG08_240052 [Vibrio owensii]|nr:hypothetical protein THZG08_240052 [Vibrio owensii]CAH1562495.1 hypothetical protein THOA03_240052 [Vibrio owensii]